LGRLRQNKLSQIRNLWDKNYTIVEISEKTGVSRGTIAKYVKQWQKKTSGPPPPSPSPIVLELARSIFRLLADLSIAPYVDQEDFLTQAADDEALRLIQRIGKLDGNVAKSLLTENAYLELLKREGVLDFAVSRDQLDPERLKQREKWLQLMKEISPESLAKFIT